MWTLSGRHLGVLKVLSRSNKIRVDSYEDYFGGVKEDLNIRENVLKYLFLPEIKHLAIVLQKSCG